MKIVQLNAENFKRLHAVEISPQGNMVVIGGRNGQGKSSILDAIWVALMGRGEAPPKPIRDGEEKATIRLDLGELIVTRTFVQKEGARYTDNLRIERPNGDRIMTKPQDVLDALIGEIGFDPFDFVLKKPEQQAEILMAMVPLSVDLDEFAELDASDFERRREVNRDIQTKEGQLAGLPKESLPDEMPDREALVAALGNAANVNAGIGREEVRREERARAALRARETADQQEASAGGLRAEAARLIDQATDLEALASEHRERAAGIDKEIEALPPLDEVVDTAALQEEIRRADHLAGVKERQDRREAVEAELVALREKSKSYTDQMAERAKQRDAALAAAEMPIKGLGFAVSEAGKPIVTYEGLPFTEDQISTAAALRVSTAIAMAANPTLRVLRIKDGSLLDDDSMAMLAEMCAAEDYQLWIERVGTGGVGIVIEDGAVAEKAGQ